MSGEGSGRAGILPSIPLSGALQLGFVRVAKREGSCEIMFRAYTVVLIMLQYSDEIVVWVLSSGCG